MGDIIMNMLDEFEKWLSVNTDLANSTVEHYKRAVKAISKDMLILGVINKSLMEMSLLELDIAINNINVNPEFVAKNIKGNRMYGTGLSRYRYFLMINGNVDDVINEDDLIGNVPNTMKEIIVKARIGQGLYRSKLMKKYDSKCMVTGINHPKLLVASHIKPWSVCSNVERIDENNGLLLSSNIDKLFDCGLITFKDDGEMKVSKFVGSNNEHILNIFDGLKVNLKASIELLRYLEYHRDILFVK